MNLELKNTEHLLVLQYSHHVLSLCLFVCHEQTLLPMAFSVEPNQRRSRDTDGTSRGPPKVDWCFVCGAAQAESVGPGGGDGGGGGWRGCR